MLTVAQFCVAKAIRLAYIPAQLIHEIDWKSSTMDCLGSG